MGNVNDSDDDNNNKRKLIKIILQSYTIHTYELHEIVETTEAAVTYLPHLYFEM